MMATERAAVRPQLDAEACAHAGGEATAEAQRAVGVALVCSPAQCAVDPAAVEAAATRLNERARPFGQVIAPTHLWRG